MEDFEKEFLSQLWQTVNSKRIDVMLQVAEYSEDFEKALDDIEQTIKNIYTGRKHD